MATPVFCCGFECGISGPHWLVTNGTFDTTIIRNGLRSGRINASASTAQLSFQDALGFGGTLIVARAYIRFTTFPTIDFPIFTASTGTSSCGIVFKSSDGKLYPGRDNAGTLTVGAAGITPILNRWYLIDIRVNVVANPWLVDCAIDGISFAQLSLAIAATNTSDVRFGRLYATGGAVTVDMYCDDILVSQTTGDYPLGGGIVNHFLPTSDGTHNVAGANDFERSATGTDITNLTTTAFQLIDDVPMKTGVPTEYINLIAPPNATDYVEVIFGAAPGINTPVVAPRSINAVIAFACSATGTNNLRVALNDNGTTNDIYNANSAISTSCLYTFKHYALAPTGGAWTVASGAGNFNNIRMRCYTNDPAPDPFLASIMIEAEFAEPKQKVVQINQSVNRSNTY